MSGFTKQTSTDCFQLGFPLAPGDRDVTTDEIETRRREHWKLLGSLKTTVEGLLSTNNPNVWSKYGGLERLCKDMNNILSHGLLHDEVYCKQKDYWRFVWCVRYVSPQLAPHVNQFMNLEERSPRPGLQPSERHKAERWLHYSLQFHCLSAQLRPLLHQRSYTRKFYTDSAFLLSDPHVTAMFQCLEAVEQNNPKLLALIDTAMLAHRKESPLLLMKSQSLLALPESVGVLPHNGVQRRYTTSYSSQQAGQCSPLPSTVAGQFGSHMERSGVAQSWLCADRGIGTLPPALPNFSVSEPATPAGSVLATHAPEDPYGELDDGPEYLAIGNLGRRCRVSHSSSTGSTESNGSMKGGPPAVTAPSSLRSALLSLPPRRSSFSEGQGAERPDGARKSHARSHSDTGVTQARAPESLPEVPNVMEYGAFSTHSSEVSTPSSLCMESEGSQVSSVSDSMFRRPSEGQSLISYLSEQDFGSCADLEKENAHFSISESLIAAIELMKCNLLKRGGLGSEGEGEEENDHEIQELKQKIWLRRQQIRTSRLQPPPPHSHSAFTTTDSGGSQHSSQESLRHSDSGSIDEVKECALKDADIKRSLTCCSGKSLLSSESICHSFLQSNSAESVAMGLLRQFEGMQLPAASELDWLVPEHEAPQKLLPIPDSLPISPDDGEHADIYKLRIRVRGNLEWAPPRPQIIFNIHPVPKRKVVVAKQNYRCAGCGIRTDPDYIKRLRYCEYLGKYFCQCCHENSQSVVPSRILRKWDFSKYYLSNFSRDLLAKIWGDPLFNVQDINSALYRKVKALEQVRLLRMQLVHIKNMFKTCRLAKELLEQFDQEPGHLTEDLHLYSLSDLSAVRKGELPPRLRELVRRGAAHVHSCMLCQAKGFICEFCGNDKDILFPFELNKCRRCEECSACYHKNCFRSEDCPRCRRLAARREQLARRNMEQYEEDFKTSHLLCRCGGLCLGAYKSGSAPAGSLWLCVRVGLLAWFCRGCGFGEIISKKVCMNVFLSRVAFCSKKLCVL
ncbi:run domain Beclin-1-interacting and cysteine-rich domain-containing protein-like isoform X2 [Polyodon spathula]|uniref:run domain Beclin-1-interacting and cysteine-rich domain-containing protein-like isoform X2 n=1 Tax=Polyodon spathula TaxID=7913 RepID=UPI001B7DF483|nr:run domain Beclin-1-interacting and cysteine-rich domain-containing protein-like isoform X2 [Polyodon spathula]